MAHVPLKLKYDVNSEMSERSFVSLKQTVYLHTECKLCKLAHVRKEQVIWVFTLDPQIWSCRKIVRNKKNWSCESRGGSFVVTTHLTVRCTVKGRSRQVMIKQNNMFAIWMESSRMHIIFYHFKLLSNRTQASAFALLSFALLLPQLI